MLAERDRSGRRNLYCAVSNPTSKSECTAKQAYSWTGGHALFASGSPFDPVTIGSEVHAPGQCNNAFIFPGVGLGLLISGSRRVSDEMFFAVARALENRVTDDELAQGRVFFRQVQEYAKSR
jgi:malate dehydrogenase (oxaloacetate-decarboxylating)(NADP+)